MYGVITLRSKGGNKMKKSVLCLMTAIIMSISISQGKTLDEYMKEAETYQELNNFDQAINTMEQAVKEYPNNSMAYTQLGVYISIQVQRIKQ
jgi:tetratricopeptide (TPR) repeat protein